MAEKTGLIEALRRKQASLSVSDGAFAQLLGVDRETWRKVRTGQMMPGRRTLQGVRTGFPELIPELQDFLLLGDASSLTSSACTRAKAGAA